MTTRLGRYTLAVIALVIVQTIILGMMVGQRAAILHSSDVVTLKSEPIDPRDLFRGDYVILNYGITSIELNTVKGHINWRDNDAIYVEIAPAEDTWRAVAVYRDYPEPELGNKIIRGQISYIDETSNTARINYGVERYYVPEGEGRDLEDQRNKQALSIDVALGSDGEAAIKGIRIDGIPVYEETVF